MTATPDGDGSPCGDEQGLRLRVARPDEAFQSHGWLKPRTEPSGKSRAPNLITQINFAFRLRQILGVGARAEVSRVLLTTDATRATAQVITESAGYAKRNVQEALTALHTAGVIDAVTVGNEQRFSIPRERWAPLLGLSVHDLPTHQAWPQLLHAPHRSIQARPIAARVRRIARIYGHFEESSRTARGAVSHPRKREVEARRVSVRGGTYKWCRGARGTT